MESKIAQSIQLRHHPVALIWSDQRPEKAIQFKERKWGCVMWLAASAAKGRTAICDRQTFGCFGGGVGVGFGNHTYFGPTISMLEHMHVQKAQFVHNIFRDWREWTKGNAILSRWEFARLGDPSKSGVPRNVPLFQPPLYQGNRDGLH